MGPTINACMVGDLCLESVVPSCKIKLLFCFVFFMAYTQFRKILYPLFAFEIWLIPIHFPSLLSNKRSSIVLSIFSPFFFFSFIIIFCLFIYLLFFKSIERIFWFKWVFDLSVITHTICTLRSRISSFIFLFH